MKSLFITVVLLGLATAAATALAQENPPSSAKAEPVTVEDGKKADGTAKPMNPDEPMATGMAKKGMKKGDVKKDATRKEDEIRKMMEHGEIRK